jgi:signal transduction histidine kinase/DNA-binding response OmpR family regulator
MVFIKNNSSHRPYYTRDDLHCMNMLLRPIWVFDIDKKAMYWANTAAIEQVWNAESLDELLQRDYASDMSEMTVSFLTEVKRKILQDPYHASTTEQWTLYPRGGEHATTIDMTCSAIMIEDNTTDGATGDTTTSTTSQRGGRIAMLVEAEMLNNESTLNDRTVRSIELLKHIPVAVSQFTMDGTKLIYQNPKASQLFGKTTGSTPMSHESSTADLNYSSEDLNITSIADANDSNDEPVGPHSTSSCVNELLERFVDVELGKNAIAMIMEKDEEFSAEVQQYTATNTTISTTTESTGRFHNQRHGKHRNTSNTPLQQPEHRWFNVSLRKTRDPVTSDFVILYMARDISDIVKARKDSIQAAMKSEFLDVMAHEIRTPLHQIIGHTDLLEDTSTNNHGTGSFNPLNSEQLVSVRQIQSSCSMLISIIDDLLDCSKLENGQVQKAEIPFDLDELLHSCIESMRPLAQVKKGLQISYHIDAKCGTTQLISDPSRLRQILHNLLSNAIKFSSVGSVTIHVRPFTKKYLNNDDTSDPLAISESLSSSVDTTMHKDDSRGNDDVNNVEHLLFEVTDTGIGIAPSEQEIVFERYRQANVNISRTFGGTGLGLPICKGLVELLGGTIGLRSTIEVGTTVYFDIPFKIAQGENSIPHGTDTSNKDQRISNHDSSPQRKALSTMVLPPSAAIDASIEPLNLDVLVVEDNAINQKVVKSMLQRLGHTVSIAENGECALQMIRQKQYQLVLMDIQMPIMDGIECTKHIRNVLKYDKERLPIIGLTAGYQPTDRDFYESEVGMNCCVGKPLPMNKLKEMIERYYCRYPNYQNTMIDLTTDTQIVAIDTARSNNHLSLSTATAVPSDRSPLIAGLKREVEVSTPVLGSEKQQQHSSRMLEPIAKKRR